METSVRLCGEGRVCRSSTVLFAILEVNTCKWVCVKVSLSDCHADRAVYLRLSPLPGLHRLRPAWAAGDRARDVLHPIRNGMQSWQRSGLVGVSNIFQDGFILNVSSGFSLVVKTRLK